MSGATMSELNDITGGNAQYTRNYTKNIANVSEDERLELPREFKSLHGNNSDIVSKHAIAYLKRRSINSRDIIRYNIG